MTSFLPMYSRHRSSLICALLLTVACTDDTAGETGETGETGDTDTATDSDTDTATDSATDTDDTGALDCEAIELPGEAFFPESISSDSAGALYVSSAGQGSIMKITACDEMSDFVAPGTDLRNAGGLLIDEANGRLLACDIDLSGMSPPEIDVFELDSGALIGSHVFEPMVSFCNDLAMDAQGNVYATNSVGPEIVRVAAADIGTDAPASIWASDARFMVPEGQTGLDGIVHDGASSLYVGMFATGTLHRVTLEEDGSAGAIEDIVLEAPLAAPDGMRWDAGDLLVTQIGTQDIIRVTLDDLAGAASVLVDGLDTPSSLTRTDDGAWVTESQLDHLLGIDPAPPTVPFRLVKVSF